MTRARRGERDVFKGYRIPDRLWPGAVERGLQEMPYLAPGGGIDLRGSEHHTWLNQVSAERQKGAPLTEVERRRIFAGRDWRPKWRKMRDEAQLRAQYPGLLDPPDET